MKTSALIGYNGFVGSNLCQQFSFSDFYNSKNIQEIKGRHFDLIVCAGIPSTMWLANTRPEEDLEQILKLTNLLRTCTCERFILISTIAIYDASKKGMTEDSIDMLERQAAYGKNRYRAEREIVNAFPQHHIIRLPALFGPHIKKNFLYDLCNQEPAFLNEQAWTSLLAQLSEPQAALIRNYYQFDERNGMYAFKKEKALIEEMRAEILSILRDHQSTALNFTHPESRFQFYDLRQLQRDIQIAVSANIRELNLCSEPIKAKDIAKIFFDIDMELRGTPQLYDYDMQSCYARKYWQNCPWQYRREQVIEQLKDFFITQGINL